MRELLLGLRLMLGRLRLREAVLRLLRDVGVGGGGGLLGDLRDSGSRSRGLLLLQTSGRGDGRKLGGRLGGGDLLGYGRIGPVGVQAAKAERAKLHLDVGQASRDSTGQDDTLTVGVLESLGSARAGTGLLSLSLRNGSLGSLRRVEARRSSVGCDWLGRIGLAMRERLCPCGLRARAARSSNGRVGKVFLLLLRLWLEGDLGLRDSGLDLGLRLGNSSGLLLDLGGCGCVAKRFDLFLRDFWLRLGRRWRLLDGSRLGFLLYLGWRGGFGLLDRSGN